MRTGEASPTPVDAMQRTFRFAPAMLLAALLAVLTACGGSLQSPARPGELTADDNPHLRVIATTTIVGDVVAQIGGDAIVLTVLLPVGGDPHAFEPSPQDVASVSEAGVVFVNGVGLETFLKRILEAAGGDAELVSVSEGVELIALAGGGDEEQGAGSHDPHVWFDPRSVVTWTQNIERALSRLDPSHADMYAANAKAYRSELDALDEWIAGQVGQLPTSDRKLVSDHDTFRYFARRYDFEPVGAVIPGSSTGAEPSARDIADLEGIVKELDVAAVFVGSTVNPTLSARVAEDTGIRLVRVYIESLSDPGGPAATYLDLMRYNVNAIVDALK